jgi:hypothetical protein
VSSYGVTYLLGRTARSRDGVLTPCWLPVRVPFSMFKRVGFGRSGVGISVGISAGKRILFIIPGSTISQVHRRSAARAEPQPMKFTVTATNHTSCELVSIYSLYFLMLNTYDKTYLILLLCLMLKMNNSSICAVEGSLHSYVYQIYRFSY